MTDVIDPVEVMARALCNHEHNTAYIWDGGGLSDDLREYWRAQARAALTAAEAAGMVWVKRDALPDLVADAMQDAWNDICADTGHHPTDLTRQGHKRELFFEPRQWATVTAMFLETALSTRPSLTGPEQERG